MDSVALLSGAVLLALLLALSYLLQGVSTWRSSEATLREVRRIALLTMREMWSVEAGRACLGEPVWLGERGRLFLRLARIYLAAGGSESDLDRVLPDWRGDDGG